MPVENSNNELLPLNIDCHAKCNKADISETSIMSGDKEMAKNSVQIHSRSKRFILNAIGNFMLLKDAFAYIMGIANPSKSQEEYFEEVLDGIQQNRDAIDRNYNAIQNIGEKVDRNFYALGMVYELVSSTLAAVEKTRRDILQKIKNSEIIYAILHLNLKIDHFHTEIKKIESLSEEEHVDKLLGNEGLLRDLRDSRIPNKDSLHTYIHNIIFQGHAIPETANDKGAFSALDSLYYGTQTYVSVMFFLLEQYTFLADYYYRGNDIDKFNKYFNDIVNCFDDFRQSLVIPGDNGKESLINNVINILITVQKKKFIQYQTEISFELSERIESLTSIGKKLIAMDLPVIRREPEKVLGNLQFGHPEIRTPIGEWKDGIQVRYAIQYRNRAIYSKVGKWSDPFTVSDKANPYLSIPLDRKNGKTRVIFRKFNNANVQLVGVLEDKTETNFTDIDRDLYNAALSYDKDKAIKEMNIYIQNGANINAEFDNGRRAIHAAAQRGNTQLAKDFFINKNSSHMLNEKDSDGFTPMHLAAAAGHNSFIELLIESGANINERTYSDELTPLHIAASKGLKPTVETFMRSNKTDLNAQDKKGFTPLHIAVFAGLQVVQALISNENVDVNAKSNTGLTALHMTVIENFSEIAETLVKNNKIDVNARSLGNFTALHFASIFKNIEMIKLLTDKDDIDINVQTTNGFTALHFAIIYQISNVASELLKVNSINANISAQDNITALHMAAITGQNNVITNLLQKKVELEAKTSDGLTALHLAAMQGYQEIVSTLLDNGANIEEKTFSGLTPLLIAASSKTTTVEVVKTLLENGANIKAAADNGESYLLIALKRGNSDVVNFIIPEDEDNYVQDARGNFFLHYAAQGGNIDVVKYLVEKKGNFVNVKNFNKETPLHLAAKSGNLDLVKYLIEKQRASIDAKNEDNETPLKFAATKGNADIAMYLIEEKRAHVNKELVLFAAEGGNLDLVKYLIEKQNIYVNARYKKSQTVLHLAARSGNLQLAKYLIDEKDADVFAKNFYHQYPLNLGIESGNMELVEYLADKTLVRQIDYRRIDVTDEYGKSPLYYAVRSNNLDLVKYLVNLGAADQNYKIPLHFAVENANIDIVKYLLSIGANINSKGYENRTPLHIALMRNDLDIAHYLLKKGEIDITVKDKFNITPLHLASQINLDIVKYLVEKGADINAKRQEELCSTPLCFAIKRGDIEIVKYLIKEGASINDAVNPEFVSIDLVNQNINNLDTLHFAVSENNSNVVKYLVQEGAEPNKPPWNGFLLLITAAVRCNFDLVKYFLQKGSDFRGHFDKYPLLHVAAKAGDLDMVKYLIDKGLDVSVKGLYGGTTLHSAADSGNVDLVKYLIEVKDMDPNDKDKLGNTPLRSAIEKGNLETAKYLMENTDANVNDSNDAKYSLLHSAVVSGNLNLVKYLTDRGADVNADSQAKNKPLHLAAKHSYFNIVKYLVENNADVNDVNRDNALPVEVALSHYVARSRDTVTSYTTLMQYLTVRYLMEQDSDADIDDLEEIANDSNLKEIKSFLGEYRLYSKLRYLIISFTIVLDYRNFVFSGLEFKDKNGWTLMHLVAKIGLFDAAKFLVGNGTSLYAKDKKNKTPADIAFDNEKYELARYLKNVKHSTDNHYHKRDIAQLLKNDAGVLKHHNISKRFSKSLKSHIIGYTESNIASGASKPFSLISVFVTILLNSVKSITSLKCLFKPTISVEYCKTCNSITVEDINTSSTIFLMDVIIKKITRQKYIYTANTLMSLPEASEHALNIVCLFKRVVSHAALYSRISLHRLNIDFVQVQKDCMGKVLGNKFNEIPEMLKLHIERACPNKAAGCSGKLSRKKFDKFTNEFIKTINIRMSQWIQNTLQKKIMTEKGMDVNEQSLGFEYKKHLSNTSIQYV